MPTVTQQVGRGGEPESGVLTPASHRVPLGPEGRDLPQTPLPLVWDGDRGRGSRYSPTWVAQPGQSHLRLPVSRRDTRRQGLQPT